MLDGLKDMYKGTTNHAVVLRKGRHCILSCVNAGTVNYAAHVLKGK
jgi:uncharacterized Zn finger protein